MQGFQGVQNIYGVGTLEGGMDRATVAAQVCNAQPAQLYVIILA